MSQIMQAVRLDTYFAQREGLEILRPSSQYQRQPAILLNPEATKRLIRNVYTERLVGRIPHEGVATFSDVTVYGPGILRLDDGHVLAESIEDPTASPPACPDAAPRRTFDAAVHVAKAGNRNYGHFLVEMLPRLALNSTAYPPDVPILLHRRSQPFASAILEAIGIDESRIVWINDEPVGVKLLYWPTRNTFEPLNNSPHIFPFLRGLARPRAGPARRRLFVGRQDAKSRHLLNEDDLFAILESQGFELVLPGRMSFRAQAKTFAEAHVVVAAAGAALTNVVFMPPEGTVLMLTPRTMAGWFFWDLASHCNQRLLVYWGETVRAHGGKSVDFYAHPSAFDALATT